MRNQGVHVTTFGYDYGSPPEADKVFDLRDLSGDPVYRSEIHDRVNEIMTQLEPGEHIALGCKLGHDRSVAAAKELKKQYGATVEHRDKHRNSYKTRFED